MNDSIQNLHKRIKKEVDVEMGRGNLIKCRYAEIQAEIVMPGLPGRTMTVKISCSVQLMKPLDRTFAIYKQQSVLQVKRNDKSK